MFVSAVSAALFAVLCVLMGARPVWADVAPPAQPPGSNITPGASVATEVAMSAEYVELAIEPRKPISGTRENLAGDSVQARVTAIFTMTNRGSKAEKMAVRFPLGNPNGSSDGFFEFPEVQQFKASVGGKVARSRIVAAPPTIDSGNGEAETIRWATFEVTFPPKKDVILQVSYVLSATGYDPEATFYYVLQTGAGWKDRIGQADLVVRLPYTVTEDNLFLGNYSGGGELEAIQAKPKLVGNTALWQLKNIEPTDKDNLIVTVLDPSVWQTILSAQAAGKAKPNDGQAWLALARAYRSAVYIKYEPSANTGRFIAPTLAAYDKAIALLPKSAAARVEYAAALTQFRPNPAGVPEQADLDNMTKVVDLLDAALKLDNKSADAREAILLAARDLEFWVRNADGDLADKTETLRDRVLKILETQGIAVG